ncbi:MAG: hypothetical protein Q7R34_11095 [Dehalococcoidia bacterium]|nr:hypothetical protein [Dehalococcoidia bacterium]
MTNKDHNGQAQAIGQAVSQVGLSGTLYLDVDPEQGFFRAKVVVTPEGYKGQLTTGLANMLAQAAGMMNLQTKIYTKDTGGVKK